MNTPPLKFEVGQQVVWRKGYYLKSVGRHRHKYGDGPFNIVDVKEVSPTERTTVGHDQWVWIRVSKRKEPVQFSGAWFVLA